MGKLGVWELLIIFAVLLLLFGATKLPQLGSSLGSAIRNFKKGVSDDAPESNESGTVVTKGTQKSGVKSA